MQFLRHILLCCFLLCVCLSAKAQAELGEDLIASILQQELNDQFSILSKREIPATYMSLTIDEKHSHHLKAMMGSPMDNSSNHSRRLKVVVNIGDYNSSQTSANIPLYDYDEQLIRNTISIYVQNAYKQALLDFQRQKIEQHFRGDKEEVSFIPPRRMHFDNPNPEWNFDTDYYMNLLCQTTSLLDEMINGIGHADLNYTHKRHWFVDSESSYVVENKDHADFDLTLTGTSPQGNEIKVTRFLSLDSLLDFPQENELKRMIEDLSHELDEKLVISASQNAAIHTTTSLNTYESHHDQLKESYSDMVFRAIRDEVEEINLELQDKKLPQPYQSWYQITKGQKFQMYFCKGSLYERSHNPIGNLNSRLLLGNNKLNNDGLAFIEGINDDNEDMALPYDSDYDNFRRVLRHSEEEAYQRAWKEYEYKNILLNNLPSSTLLQRPQDRFQPSPSRYDAVSTYEQPDLSRLEALASDLSLCLANELDSMAIKNKIDCSDINTGVNLYGFQADVYYYSTDGIQYVQPFSLMCLRFDVSTLSKNGDLITNSEKIYFREADDLPDLSVMIEKAQRLSQSICALKTAPTLTSMYDGPVLVTDDAAAQLFAYTFANAPTGIYAYREPIHDETRGFNNAKSMENRLQQQVINATLDVDAIDTLTYFNGMRLIGQYVVDAEGLRVPPYVEIIQRGELYDLLTDRIPTDRLKTSNAHRRLAISNGMLKPMVGAGILKLTSHNQLSEQKLKKRLCEQARAAGYEFAYMIRKVDDYHNALTGSFLPVMVYQVDVRNGKETLVRADIVDVQLDDFMHLSAASKEQIAYNLMVSGQQFTYSSHDFHLSGVPCSVIVPKMLYFDRLRLVPRQ